MTSLEWLAPVQLVLSLLVVVLVVRGMRGRRLGWPVLPLSAVLPGALLGLVMLPFGLPSVGLATAATLCTFGLLGTALGVALALRGHAHWNLRRAWGAAAAVMAVAVELALLAAFWRGEIAPQDWGTPAMLLLSGMALALAASRRGATPEAALWTRRLRYGTSLTVALAFGAWWLRAEALAMGPSTSALAADHAANASTLAAWVLPAGLAMALLPSLAALRLPWVRRMGPLVLGAGMLAAPLVLTTLVLADRAQCDDHQPNPDSLAQLIARSRTRSEAPWCRSAPEYAPVCEDELSRWTLRQDGWNIEGARFRGPDALKPATVEAQVLRRADGLGLGPTFSQSGRWHPEDIDQALQPHLAEVEACLSATQPTAELSLRVWPSEEGSEVSLRGLSDFASQLCVEEVLAEVALPAPGCDGSPSFTTSLTWQPRQSASR